MSLIPGQSVCDLWRKKLHWRWHLSEYFSFPLSAFVINVQYTVSYLSTTFMVLLVDSIVKYHTLIVTP